jgi:hypothetical protein
MMMKSAREDLQRLSELNDWIERQTANGGAWQKLGDAAMRVVEKRRASGESR